MSHILIAFFVFVCCTRDKAEDDDQPFSSAQFPPYPPSRVVESIGWDFDNIVRKAPGSDLWPMTWAVDDKLYTSWGDGVGFGATNYIEQWGSDRVSLGFARIEGSPTDFKATNVWGGKNAEHSASFGGKCAGLLSVDGVLYAWINVQNGNPPDIKLGWSEDYGAHWQLSTWEFSKYGTFFPSTFLNFGKDYAGARDENVYVYGGKWIYAQGAGEDVFLASVNKNRIKDRTAYEFFKGMDASGNPMWASNINERRPVFTDPNGVGNSGLAHVVYNPGIKRYLLTAGHRSPRSDSVDNEIGRLGIFDAPEPWGPWTTVAYYENWGGFGKGPALGYAIPTKWISADGKTIWVAFSSTGELDSLNLVRASLTLKNR
ncbi:MAG: hypothetical protein AB1390_02795 [Nitrospirota bacterium]